MANQIIVESGSGNVTVTTSRSVIGTVANVASANVANTVLNNAQPNITSVGTLTTLAVSGDITTVDSITLDTAATEAYAAAKLWWDDPDGTFSMGMYNSVTQQVGQQLYFYGKAVGNIVKGQSVMFAGVQGDHILMSAADASSVGFKKEYLIGIASQNITNGNFGYVTWFGKISSVNTAGFATGSLLWFDPTTVGGLTNVEPTGNSIKVLLAAVIKAETSGPANNGVLLVRPTFEPNINDIQGVQVATPLDGQVLTYNAANSTWINANVTANVSNVAYAANAGNAVFANTAAIANIANVAYSVSGSNVTGTVANAAYAANAGNANTANTATVAASANSVTLANVSGAGNIASINLDGSAANVLYGNGVFAPAATGNVANANYANFAGTAFSVSGSNVSGAVANATYADNAGNATNANIANIANIAYSVDAGNVNGTVANAAYADNAGNANVAYSVDVANVANIGNIATINLDGNASNLLDGTGNWVAIPAAANANFANFAGEVINAAQPNITSVGTLTTLNANTSSPITVASSNGNVIFRTTNTANISGQRVAFEYINPVTNNLVALGADEAGFGYFIANTAPGNVIPGNIKSYWQFQSNGNLTHLLGGTGNVNVKGATVTGNVNASGAITAPNITANTGIFTGNAAGLTNIPGGNVTGTVANATYADNAGNANIANIAYSVDAANVVGLGNIATINLDGNASNFLDGTGNFVALPATANANFANFAGEVTNAAQPNITSVGTLTSLVANTASAINLTASNSNIALQVTNSANTPSTRVNMTYTNPVVEQLTSVGADDAGFAVFISNTNPGNTIPANIKSYWQFATNGNLQHTIGGTGAIVAKQGVFGTGNVSAGNVVATANVQGNIVVANYFYGDGSNISGISATNANYANFAGDVVNATQSNITTVGTLTGLTVNATANANIDVANASGYITVTESSALGTRAALQHYANAENNVSAAIVGNTGITMYAANTAPGNVGFGNIKALWQFTTSGNLSHTIGGAGAIVAKQGVFGTGNVSAGNVVTPTISTAGTLNLSTNGITNGVQVTGRQITLNGANTGAGDISQVNLINGALNWTLDNTTFSGGTPFGMNRYNVGFLEPLNYYTARGNASSPADVQAGDAAYSERMQVRYNGATSSIFNGDVTVESFSPANTVAARYTIASYDDQANSVFQVNFGTSNFNGNVNVGSGNITLDTSGIINVNDQIQIGGGNISLDGGAGLITAPESAIANTQLNRFQETTFNVGNVSGTITPDFNDGSIQQLTVTGNITLNSLGNAVAGRSMTLIVAQDGTGGHILTSSMLFAGADKTLSTAANSIDIISVFYDGSTYYASLSKGYA